MHKILFDNETTGLLKPEINELSAQPYITEIHCTKIDEDFNMIGEYGTLVKPPVPIPSFLEDKIGITNEMVKDAPAFIDIWEDLADFFLGAEMMIAHNLAFDRSMVANELLRIERVLNFPWPKIHLCTVEASMPIEQRRITLTNLHTIATGKPFEGAHRAKEDVHALVRCYHYLTEKGLA